MIFLCKDQLLISPPLRGGRTPWRGRVGLRERLDNDVRGVRFQFQFHRNAEHFP
jgi:hypothetical protein